MTEVDEGATTDAAVPRGAVPLGAVIRRWWPFEWHPELRTTALLIAVVYAYFAYLNLQGADTLVRIAIGQNPFPLPVLPWPTPSSSNLGLINLSPPIPIRLRTADALLLATGFAECLVVMGALAILLRRRAVATAFALLLDALIHLGSLINAKSEVGAFLPTSSLIRYIVDIGRDLIFAALLCLAYATARRAVDSP
jgi:hypothetical protein